MKNILLLFFLVLLFTGCSSWLEIEDTREENIPDFKTKTSYYEYTSGYKTADIGSCVVCGRRTSSGMIKYCSYCWNGQQR